MKGILMPLFVTHTHTRTQTHSLMLGLYIYTDRFFMLVFKNGLVGGFLLNDSEAGYVV